MSSQGAPGISRGTENSPLLAVATSRHSAPSGRKTTLPAASYMHDEAAVAGPARSDVAIETISHRSHRARIRALRSPSACFGATHGLLETDSAFKSAGGAVETKDGMVPSR